MYGAENFIYGKVLLKVECYIHVHSATYAFFSLPGTYIEVLDQILYIEVYIYLYIELRWWCWRWVRRKINRYHVQNCE